MTDFISCKRKNNEYLSEKIIINYASQLLSVLDYLHSKKYIHLLGEISPGRIYFTQMYDNIYFDIGENATTVSNEWLIQNSETLLTNGKFNI